MARPAPGNNLFRWFNAAGPPRDLRSAAPWGSAPTGQPNAWAFMDQAMKHLVHLDPEFDTTRNPPVDARGVVGDETWARIVARTAAGSADDPAKLGPFVASNRKLILYHGYNDGFITPSRTVRFYQEWAGLAGGYDALKRNARLFMAPGMYHCSRGPGPNSFDMLGALERWVEQGVAPEGVVATKHADDDRTRPALRTMPLCSFPTQARYSGSGDVNRAANWSCAANQGLLQIGPNGATAGLDAPERPR